MLNRGESLPVKWEIYKERVQARQVGDLSRGESLPVSGRFTEGRRRTVALLLEVSSWNYILLIPVSDSVIAKIDIAGITDDFYKNLLNVEMIDIFLDFHGVCEYNSHNSTRHAS